MSTYTATIRWSREARRGDFAKGQYSRAHEWAFDGGAVVPASAEPAHRARALVGPGGRRSGGGVRRLLSSCHMLFFLDFARRGGFVVDSYVDEAKACSRSAPTGGWR